MKTGNLLLIGSAFGVFYFRKTLFPDLVGKVNELGNDVKSSFLSKVSIEPYKRPSIKVDILSGSINLKGQIEVMNKTPLAVTINSYQIDLVLKNSAKSILVGSTPLNSINSDIKGNGNSLISYLFNIKISSLKELVQNFSQLGGYKLCAVVKDLKVNSIPIPDTEIDTGLWKDITDTLDSIKNPTALISDIINNL